MPFTYNPHRHVKIWLPKDKESFLNIENQLRLIRMRATNPNDSIHLVYDSRLFSAKALKELGQFCQKYKIQSKDVFKDIIPFCETAEEQNLIKIYELEINRLSEGGSLEAASNILRWLKPIYKLGTYSSFKVEVDTSQLAPTISVDKPLLFKWGSIVFTDNIEALGLCNETIAVVNSKKALPKIQRIQQQIFANYFKQSKSIFAQAYESVEKSLGKFFDSPMIQHQLSSDPGFKSLKLLDSMSQNKSNLRLRKKILRYTETNLDFVLHMNNNPKMIDPSSEQQLLEQSAKVLRESIKNQLGWISWLFMPSFEYKYMEALASIEDNDLFLSKMRQNHRYNMLKTSIAFTSGPGAITEALYPDRYCLSHEHDQKIAPASFGYYGLDKVFYSSQYLPLHSSPTAALELAESEASELSGLEEGQDATFKHEQKIVKAGITFQRFLRSNQARAELNVVSNFHEMKDKIETHIQKIKSDLTGCFGFYRSAQRQKKIDALTNLLKHFVQDDHYFNVDDFKKALPNYCTEDVFASIGKSITKELITELINFCNDAEATGLKNKKGLVEIVQPSVSRLQRL